MSYNFFLNLMFIISFTKTKHATLFFLSVVT